MARSLYSAPKAFLFIADGVQYTIREVLSPGSNTISPCILTFAIEYFNKNAGRIEGYTTTEEHSILVYPEQEYKSGNRYLKWNVDITNMMIAYAQRLYISRHDYISGYATVQLVEIDGVSSDEDTTPHICLFGTAGGIEIDSDTALPETTHPFLLARGNEEGALHFYRSELKAMDFIYALKPDFYDSIQFDTDERSFPDQELDQDMYFIYGHTELLGIHFYEGDRYNQYDLTEASAIFLHLISEQPGIDSRIYTIAIQDDPNTDETHLIRWTNSMGAPEALLFTGELKDKSDVEKADLYIHEQQIRNIQRAQQRGLVTTKYSLHTGYLTPARIIALRDMLTSEEVEMYIDGEWIPVSVESTTEHAVHQREPETFELTIEVLEQTRYHKPNRTVRPLPSTRAGFLQDNRGNIILDNNSNTIEENGSV